MPRYGETSRGKTALAPTDVARTCARKFGLESPAALQQRRIIRRLEATKSVACRRSLSTPPLFVRAGVGKDRGGTLGEVGG